MAIERKDKKAGISAAPVAIATPVLPSNAHSRVTPRGSVHNRKAAPETSPVTTPEPVAADREHDVFFQRFIRLALMDANTEDVTAYNGEYLTYEDLTSKKTLTQAEIFNANPLDPRVQETQVAEHINHATGRRSYYVGEGLTEQLAARNQHQNLPSTGRPLTSRPDNFRMTSIGQIQREMHQAIEIAARETGVPAKLLGAMAGKESLFGKQQISSSGAEGLFHQTDGYLKSNYVQNPQQAARIAAVVPEAAEYMADGKITISEANRLAWNLLAAAMLTGLRAKAVAKDFNLDLNDERTWGYVYTDHNAGRASLKRLVSGGMTEGWIQKLNPSMYKGVKSGEDVLRIATDDMIRYGNRYEKLATAIANTAASPIVVAENKKHRLPAPEPS